MIEEMSDQRKARDKHISSLIEEVRTGFSSLSSSASKQQQEHQKEMTGLYQTLQSTFGQIKDNSVEKDKNNQNIFKSLSDSMMHDHELTLKEINEQGKLQDKKLEYMTQMLEQRTRRNRLIAIPGMVIAIVAVIYMFYVVSIMETAMSNMSANMQLMQADVNSMSGNMGSMSTDTASINNNMQQLNGNMGRVSQDLNVLTHNVAPAMKGMRDVMPWAP
jgi:methyl-accepting chemotaxis protein